MAYINYIERKPTMIYHISFDDALDHSTVVDSFEVLEEAKKAFQDYVNKGPDGYDIAVELVEENDDYELDSIEFHEWFTQEEWTAAHPSGFPN